MRRNQAAAAPHVISQRRALALRQRGDVRQHQDLEAVDPLRLEAAIVRHLERDARLDQGVIVPERVVLHPCRGALAAVERGGLLREDQRDARQRRLVAEIALGAVVPAVDVFHHFQPAVVVQRAGELREPRAEPVGDPVGHPDADLGVALDRVLPAIRLLDSDAEDPHDRLAAERGAVLLAVLPVAPGRGQAAPRLAVREERVGQLSDRLHVEVRQRAAAGVGDEARRGVERADLPVPQPPQLEEPLLAPDDVGATRRIARVRRARQLHPGSRLEVAPAVLAVAHPRAAPAVAEDAVHAVETDDLSGHLGHVLEVVGTERARHPQLRRGPVPALASLGVDGDPVRVRFVDVLVRGVRVGARDHDHPELAAPGDQVAERVAVLHPRRTMVQRNLRRVVRDAAPGRKARGVGVHALEVVEPEPRIVGLGIVLDQGELRPAHRPVEPAGGGGRGCLGWSARKPPRGCGGQRRASDELPTRNRIHGNAPADCGRIIYPKRAGGSKGTVRLDPPKRPGALFAND